MSLLTAIIVCRALFNESRCRGVDSLRASHKYVRLGSYPSYGGIEKDEFDESLNEANGSGSLQNNLPQSSASDSLLQRLPHRASAIAVDPASKLKTTYD